MRDNSGAPGIAWLGTVCGSKAYRTNINEYYYNDLDTAQVIPFIINFSFVYCFLNFYLTDVFLNQSIYAFNV